MNFELANKLERLIENRQLDEAIILVESELRQIPNTNFHKILGRNLLHLTPELTQFIKEFDKATSSETKPAAYYCEMNGFTINYNRWFIDLFSYEEYNLGDWDWLSEYYDYTDSSLTITGFEDIQEAFKDVHENQRFKEPDISKAYDVCELLVILRLQELFKQTYKEAQDDWSNIPMFVTAHDYELIYRAND